MKSFTLGKVGSKGSKKVTITDDGLIKLRHAKPPATVFGSMTKGEARRLRKGLRANGFANIAAIRRAG